MKPRVLVVGGGTGGHLFGAIALCDILVDNWDVMLATDERCRRYLPTLPYQSTVLDIPYPCLRHALGSLVAFFKIAYFMINQRPKVVIVSGSYVCLFFAIWSVFIRAKLIVYEQNAVFGKANTFFSYFAEKIFLGFEGTKRLPKVSEEKFVVTGNPARIAITTPPNRLPPQDTIHILITAGSQGSLFFDNTIPHVLVLLAQKLPNVKICVHQQIRTHNQALEDLYKAYDIDATLLPFFTDMTYEYTWAHLLISRAGASTIAEIIASQLPAILIPYRHAAYDHQTCNANALVSNKAAWMLQEDEATQDAFASRLHKIATDPNLYTKTVSNLMRLRCNNREIILDAISKVVDNRF